MTDRAGDTTFTLKDLDARTREIFRSLVETYLATGEPVGSRTLSRLQGIGLSPASIRNTMQDLALSGLLAAPHVSAGRVPTQRGLRLFVDGLLEHGDLSDDERREIDAALAGSAASVEDLLERASDALSALTGAAGLVTTPASDAGLRHVEFVPLSREEVLAVLVFDNGAVENRLLPAPAGVTPSAMIEAGNYLSARLKGRNLSEASAALLEEIEAERAELDNAARRLISDGLAEWAGGDKRALIVRGRAKLLTDVQAAEDLERVRLLFDDLERKQDLIALLDRTRDGPSVKIFIGSENPLFSLSGSSVIAAPYMNGRQRVIGAIGVIGPTRLNYARVIPLVDYTARVIGKLLGDA